MTVFLFYVFSFFFPYFFFWGGGIHYTCTMTLRREEYAKIGNAILFSVGVKEVFSLCFVVVRPSTCSCQKGCSRTESG